MVGATDRRADVRQVYSQGAGLRESLERVVVMFDKSFHRIHLNTREAERKGESLWTFILSGTMPVSIGEAGFCRRCHVQQ
jgi:hypothetical protein